MRKKEKRNYKKLFLKKFLIALLFSLFIVSAVDASDMTSTNFIIRDPIIGTGGSYSTSTNFKMFGSGETLFTDAISSTSFLGHFGFLYYPYVVVGTLTATPVGTQVDLSWGASTAGQGWSVSGYKTGIASVSGGPYTYTSVGNVTDYSYTELAPGNYCFVVQTLDSLGYVIGISNESCATVLPVITFDLDTSVADAETGTPYSVALGIITTTDTRVSGSTDSINMIIAESDTNAAGGMAVTVRNTNGANGLVSTAVPADNIGSADGAIADGTENYGLCVISVTQTLGTLSKASPYDTGTCAADSETNDIQGLTTAGENIVSSTAPLSDGRAQVAVNAAISGITVAHADYTDTLTFVATATF